MAVFEDTLSKVLNLLCRLKEDGIVNGFVLIGGLAVAIWRIPRATVNIDFLVVTVKELVEIEAVFRANGFKTKIFRDLITRPSTVLRVWLPVRPSVVADLFIADDEIEKRIIEGGVVITYAGMNIPVVTIEDLIILKIRAGREQDLMDVKGLLKGKVDWKSVKERADRLGLKERLDKIKEG